MDSAKFGWRLGGQVCCSFRSCNNNGESTDLGVGFRGQKQDEMGYADGQVVRCVRSLGLPRGQKIGIKVRGDMGARLTGGIFQFSFWHQRRRGVKARR